MNISNITRLTTLFLLSFILFSSCRTEPKIDAPKFKNANSKTAYASIPVKLRTLNPILHRAGYAMATYEPMIQTLLNYDYIKKEIVPVLVKSFPAIEEITEGKYAGGMRYTYEIKEDAVWDDGSPVTAYDVDFSVKTVFAPKVKAIVFPYYFDEFKAIEMDESNPKKFSVILGRKYILGEELSGYITVLPEYIYDENKVLRNYTLEDFKNKEKKAELEKADPKLTEFAEAFNSPKFSREIIKGSGPYKLESWEAGQKIILSRKKDWWGDKYKGESMFMEANPDTLFYRVIPDQTPLAAAVQNEDLDVAYALNSLDFVELQKSERLQSLYNFYTPQTLNFYFTYINTKAPFLTDKNVRRALAHLIDVETVIETLYDGLAVAQVGPVDPRKDYYNSDLPIIPYDVEKASNLLAAAGWTDSDNNGILDKEIDGERKDLVLNYVSSDTKFARNYAAYMKENFKDAGVELNVEIMDFQKSRKRQAARDFDLASGALSRSPVATDFFPIYHTSSDTPTGPNRSGFGTAESDQLLEQIQITLDSKERMPLYKRFQEIMYEEQPKIFTFSPQERIVIHKRFKGQATGARPWVYLPALEFVEQ